MPKQKKDWRKTARQDPEIQLWFEQITKGKLAPSETARMMSRDESYDYQAAIKAGIRPAPNAQGQYHWPSVIGETGQWLKADWHPTAWKEWDYRVRQREAETAGFREALGKK